jgi:hypothetical protein
LLYWYKSTCITGTKSQILTPAEEDFGVLSIVSFEAVGEMLGNSENKTGLSHKSHKLKSFPPPSIFVLCSGTYKLRCTF